MPIDSHLSYLEKHALLPALIPSAPEPDLGLVVLVSARSASGLQYTLNALDACIKPPVAIEVFMVFHQWTIASPEDQTEHKFALQIAIKWMAAEHSPGIEYHVLSLPDVAPLDFGDGLTRKLAFDEALRRLQAVGNTDAPIAWLDPGVVVDESYLQEIHRYFLENRRKTSCTTQFFTLQEPEECTLRYAMLGLRTMRHPHAYYHMASVVVVRGSVYARESGMNRRKVGADFHFLHKLTPLEQHGDCPEAIVLYMNESPDFKAQETVFAPAAYHLLRDFAARVLASWQQPADTIVAEVSALHPALAEWLATAGFAERLAGMQASATQAASFRQRFFRWFSVLEVQHFMNFAHPAYFERLPLVEAAAALLDQPTDSSAEFLLDLLRERDRQPYSNSL